MPSAAELRAELKALRKEHPDHTPVSKMKKGDISDLIQRMKMRVEETPAVAAVKSADPKIYRSAVETVKKAKEEEFPLEIHSDAPAASKKMTKKAAPAKKAAKAEAPAKKGRPAKGSDEAKERMHKIRMMKGKKPADA